MKKIELAVKKVIQGKSGLNPEFLDLYKDIPELQE